MDPTVSGKVFGTTSEEAMMALDFNRLRKSLNFTRKEKGAPNLTLDVRIEVRAIDKPEVGGLIWKVGSPAGGYGRNTNQAAFQAQIAAFFATGMLAELAFQRRLGVLPPCPVRLRGRPAVAARVREPVRRRVRLPAIQVLRAEAAVVDPVLGPAAGADDAPPP
jgi:hypothetical protein